jgi:hypothetical protein
MANLSRKEFLRLLATGAGAALGGPILSGCAPAQATLPSSPPADSSAPAAAGPTQIAATPTEAISPSPYPTRTPFPTPTQTPTLLPARRPDVLKFFPESRSTVVRARHGGVWAGDQLAPEALQIMLDRSICALTGLGVAGEGWRALFDPQERIAIKVNAFRNSRVWTHAPLVTAVTDSLQAAGIPAENIFIFDYQTDEMVEAGFAVNKDGPGLRCYGTDRDYATGWQVGSASEGLSNILLNCHALINMPTLKAHMISGMTFAMKNHYGSVSYPDSIHNVTTCIPALNALAPIKDRTRLVIGDMLAPNLKCENAYPYWRETVPGDSFLMSFDPVALDAVGLDWLTRLMKDQGLSTAFAQERAGKWLAEAARLGLGAADPLQIKQVEVEVV